MTSANWSKAQSKFPILSQILEATHNKTSGKWKLKSDMDFDLKSLIRIRKQMKKNHTIQWQK